MKKTFDRLSPLAAAMACAALFLLSETPVRAAGTQLLHGHVPPVVARLHPLGNLDETNRLKLAIGLPLRDKWGLTNLLQQIYDPTSPNYHHYMTVEQFTERFGASKADYEALRNFVKANGLTEIQTHPNRMLLDVDASVADIRRVLHVNLSAYNHPRENRQFYAPDSEPSLDLSVPILHISGLDNYVLPHPFSHKLSDAKGGASPLGGTNNTPLNGSGPGGSIFGYDFRNAYAPGVTLTGVGQNSALLEFDSYYASDITAYEAQASLPSVNLVNVPVSGGIIGLPGAGVGEVSLDIEMVIAMAPGISTLFVYEAPNGSPCDSILSRMATDNSSKQISSSWGYQTDTTSEQLFQEFAVQGQSFYQASGDSDAYVGPIATPEDDPYITLVGGTTLTMNGSGTSYASEKVWNLGYQPPGGAPQFNNFWGSGGGISTTWRIPIWQQGVIMTNNQGSTNFRNLPDVAMTADNIWVIAGNQTQNGPYGGTSCAAPLWNGFTALVNQQGGNGGLSPVGFINPAVYAIGKGASYSSCFHDIVLGDNTWTNGSPTNFYAVPGYDLCTGWGTPNGVNLINALAPISTAPVLVVLTNIVSGGNGDGIIDFDECNNLTIVLTNESRLAATGVQATLYSTTTGAIVGQGSSSYPVILPSNSAPNLTYFTLSTEPSFVCGTPVNLTLVVKSDQVVVTNYIQLPSGLAGPPIPFTNSTPFPIPTNFVPANSSIQVTGLDSSSVNKITVSLFLADPYDSGMTLQLIGPNGTNVILCQNQGGFSPNFGIGCGSTNYETTFDDAASVPIALGTPPFLGSFAPQQPLSVFHLANGTNLNGIWTLQVQNAFPAEAAVLECWTLNVYPEVCVDGGGQCPGADLSLTMSASPTTVFLGSNVIYTMTVSNAGPSTAQDVAIIQGLPAGVVNVVVTNSSVSVNQSGTNLTMTLASLPVYGTATISVSATLTTNTLGTNTSALVTSVASVGSPAPDSNPDNNTASATVTLSEPAADLAVTMTASPSSVLQGGLLTYTINVTNNGPSIAKGVTLATILPANANFVSATTSQGSILFNGTYAILGDLPLGTNVVVTIAISPTTTGNIIASATAFLGANSFEIDPITFNNTAAVSTTVGPAADLGVTAFALPSPVVAGSNLNYIVTVSNAGPSAATGVVVNQTLPVGSTFSNSTLAGYTVANGLFTANIGSLSNSGSIRFTNVVKSPTLLPGVQSQLMISTVSVFGQPGDPNTANNNVTLQIFAQPPTVTIVAAGATVTSGSANGSVGPTGTYGVQLSLENLGTIPTTHLVATLQNGNGVTSSSGSQTYGVLVPEATPTPGQFSFTASSSNGGTITAALQLQDGTNNLGTVNFTFVMPVVQTFWNANLISIPYPQSPDDMGPASPYPSAITVSGVNGDVSTVTVTVSNLLHAYPNDIAMLLVGPTGASCVLMSAAAEYSGMTMPATVTFDQNAPLVIPGSFGQIVSGSYQPADYYLDQYSTGETFSNSPAPIGPYNTNLGIFSSVPANGTWSLYIEDDAEGDAGAISNGWSLSITTITPVNPVADLAASMVTSNSTVILGDNITNIWTLTNNGPSAAIAVVTNVLPPGSIFVTNFLPPGATSVQNGQTNLCILGNLIAGAGAVVTNVVTAMSPGFQTNVITVGSSELDGNLINNTAVLVTTVNPPPAELIVAPISVVPNPVVINSNLVYMVAVTNLGPSNAFSVVGSFALGGLQYVSAVPYPSPGASCALINGSVQCNLGTIPAGGSAEVTITAVPLSIGFVTNFWSVTTTSTNSNFANNSVSANVQVIYPTPVITIGQPVLQPQTSPPLNGAINSNQTNTVLIPLINIGAGATTNLIATLQSVNGIRPITTSNNYGPIAPGGSASRYYAFVGSGSPGSTLTAVWSLQDGTNSLGTVTYPFVLPVTMSFNNPAQITIPAFGVGIPYPSAIQVSGLTNFLLEKVTVALNGFTHSFPHDVEAVLVGPGGQGLVLMASTGGPYAVSNLVLTFDDAATQELPLTNISLAVTNLAGTFLPTTYSPFVPLPSLPTVPATNTSLAAAFNGINPNGIWSLYVYDDTQGNDGFIADGWSLNLTAVSPVNPTALLSMSTVETPNPAIVGDYVNYQITVSNAGPGYATNVVLTDTTANGVKVIKAINNLGTIQANAFTNVTIQLIVETNATLTNTAVVTTASTDLNLAGCTNIIITPAIGAAPRLSASFVNGQLQFTVPGYLGQDYAIQTSTNLLLWSNVSTNTGLFIYTNTLTNASHRFYRAIQLPH
jgi:uncharacterized repeat protein (TIGR01451 family)